MRDFFSLLVAKASLAWLVCSLLVGPLVLLPALSQAQGPVWQTAAAGSPAQMNGGTSTTMATAVDASGNVYVTGSFTGQVAFDDVVLSTTNSAIFVAKWLPASSTWAWAKSGSSGVGQGIAVSGSNVYVTGIFYGSAYFDNIQLIGTTYYCHYTQSDNAFVARYTDAGTSASVAWATALGQGGGNGIAVSGSNVYVAGNYPNYCYYTSGFFGSSGYYSMASDARLTKLVDNGTSASTAWSRTDGGTYDDRWRGVAVNGSAIYVTGSLENSSSDYSAVRFGSTAVPGVSAYRTDDLAVARYTDNGSSVTFQWVRLGGGQGDDYGKAVAVSGTAVYVTGSTYNTAADNYTVRFGTTAVPGASTAYSDDLLLARYTDNTTSATFNWARAHGGTMFDEGSAIVVNNTAVYVAGRVTNDLGDVNGVRFATTAVAGASATNSQDVLVAQFTASATAGTFNWARTGGGIGSDYGQGLALSGTTLYLGGTIGSEWATFGTAIGSPLAGSPNYYGSRGVLGRLSVNGTSTAWHTVVGPSHGGISTTTATTTDASGDVLVTGYFSGDVRIGSTTLSSAGSNDWFVAKYLPASATWAWAVRGGGTGDERPAGLTVSGSAIYVAGYLTNNTADANAVRFGSTAVAGASTTVSTDLALARYTDNSSSATLDWARTGGGTGADAGTGVALSGSNVYVSGYLNNNTADANVARFSGTAVAGASATTSDDALLVRYTDNTSSATFNWARTGGGSDIDRGQGVAVNGSAVYLTGSVTNNAADANVARFSGTAVAGASASASADVLLARYTDAGSSATFNWARLGGGTGADAGAAVAVRSNLVYVTGSITNNLNDGAAVRFGSATVAGASTNFSSDVLLARYTDNTTGASFDWAQAGGGVGTDQGTALVVNGSAVYLTGSITNTSYDGYTVRFGATEPVPGAGGQDVLVAGYTDAGSSVTFDWATTGGGASNDIGTGLALAGTKLYVGGSVQPAATFSALTISNPTTSNSVVNFLGMLDLSKPNIGRAVPARGVAGTTVTLRNYLLGGASNLVVNGVSTPITANTYNSISFVVPAGASATQLITANTTAGPVSTTAFTVRLAVAGTSPTPNAVAAPLANSATAVTFTEPVTAATAAGLRVFSAQSGGRKAGTAVLSGATASYTSSLPSPGTHFRPGETVRVSIPTPTNAGGLTAPSYVYQFTTVASGTGAGNFQPPTTNAEPAAGTNPRGVATGDLDGDGDLDMLVANYGTSSVSVRLNNGSGSFTAPASSAEITVAASPLGIALGDIDGDGDLDAVVSSTGTTNLLLNNGSAVFTSTGTAYGGSSPVLGDLDGDGDLDLVSGNTVSTNNGSGVFSYWQTISTGTPENIALGDIDGDGDLDLVSVSITAGANYVSVLSNDGQGYFYNASTPSVGTSPSGIALGDLDGDGDLDLVTANSGINTISICLNNGMGAFAAPAANPNPTVGNGPKRVELGDVDADGDLDVLTTNYTDHTATVSFNNGTGTLIGSGAFAVGTNPYGLALGDVDGDGDLDVLTAGSGGSAVSVRLNQAPAPLIGSFSPASAPAGATVAVNGYYINGMTALTVNGVSVPLTNVSNNTATGFSFVVPAGTSNTPLVTATTPLGTVSSTAFTAELRVSSTSPAAQALAAPLAGSALTLNFSEPVTAAGAGTTRVFSAQVGGRKAGTWTGGGTASLSFTSNLTAPRTDFRAGEVVSVSIPGPIQSVGGLVVRPKVVQFTTAVAGLGQGIFQAPATNAEPAAGTTPRGAAIGDLDGDGDLDMLVPNDLSSGTVGVRLNNGSGSFSGTLTIATGTNTGSVALGDVDGDGDLDFVATNYGSGTVSVGLNNGNATFATPVSVAVAANPNSVALGDVDADGDLDFVTSNYNSYTASVRINNGSGAFSAPATGAEVSVNYYSSYVALGDVDNDGDLDMLVASADNYSVSFRLNSGAGLFAAPASGSSNIYVIAPQSIALGDLDADGDLDLVAASYYGGYGNTVGVWLNNGAGAFTAPATGASLTVGAGPYHVALGDVDHDGDLDLATANYTTGANSVSLALNNGNGTFGAATAVAVGSQPIAVALADLDGDLDLDLLAANYGSATVSVRLNQPPLPGLISFSPSSAPVGSTVAVTGYNLSGITALTVNGATVPLSNISNSTATGFSFIVPAGATSTGTTTVTTGYGSASSTAFTVLLPALTAVAPWLGVPGTVLTLTGTDLTGVTSITFSGSAGVKTVSNGFTVNGAGTSITGVVVPAGAQSGPLTVTTSNGTSVVGTVFFSRAKTLAAGSSHTVALRPDGTLWAWGSNGNGQLGKGNNTTGAANYSPVQMGTASTWVSVAAGTVHTVAVRADGTLWAWGDNTYGQLGRGNNTNSVVANYSPVQVGTATNWVSATAGYYHTAAVRADGTLWAWGYNGNGQLGKGTIATGAADYSPVQVGTATNWVSAGAGANHTAAVRADGTLWTWGRNDDGQLGQGTATVTAADYSPAQVGTATTWVSAAGGSYHTLAVRADGTLWAWGFNGNGQLGKGTNTSSTADYSPVQMGTATSWASAAAGVNHTASVRADGTLWTLGDNSQGQLGKGTIGITTADYSPVQVGTATSWTSATTGTFHTAGEQSCRAVWAWGYNGNGPVGDGTNTDRYSPVLVINPVALLSFTPASATVGSTVAVTGTGLSGLTALTVNGATVALSNITNASDTGFSFVVPAGATGTGTTTVAAGCGSASSTGFTLSPVLSGLSPWLGAPGTVLTLTGTNLTGVTSITFSGSAGVKTVTSGFTVNGAGTGITGIVVPAGAQSGPVTVTTGGGTSVVVNTVFFSRATSLATGQNHTVAVRADGTLWAWGDNQYGQLGKGTNTNSAANYSPVQIGTASSWVSAAAGGNYTVAVRADGTLWAWGQNQYGQLGQGNNIIGSAANYSPVQVGTASTWVSATTGYYHTMAVRADGTLWAWGDNQFGQLGKGTNASSAADYSPVQVGTASTWVSAAAGGYHTGAVRADGTLWAWGNNNNGQLGKGSTSVTAADYSPVQVGAATSWTSAAAGPNNTAGVRADGTLWAWGYNGNGQLGQGNTNAGYTTPVQVGTATSWASATVGLYHTAAVRADGTLWTWGYNVNGQLGKGNNTNVVANYSPMQVGTATSWTSAAAGEFFTAGEQSCRAVWAWGYNGSGQLGDGTTADKYSPVQVVNPVSLLSFSPSSAAAGATVAVTGTGLSGISALSVNGATALVSITNNTATGFSFVVPAGATATGTTTVAAGCGSVSSTVFTVRQPTLAAGSNHTVSIRPDGTLWAWGYNTYNQLGDGTTTDRISPVKIGAATNWQSVAAGNNYSLAIRTDGTLWAWGYNANGQLGDGSTTNRSSPVQVGAVTTWRSLAAGDNHTVAVRTDGTLWAWGFNNYGQLGDGTFTTRLSPVRIGTGTTWQSVAAGDYHTMAVRADGTLWAWGYNGYGNLGNGTTTYSTIPVQIGAGASWQSVAAGDYHTLAQRTDGTLWAWGLNSDGELGDGSTTQRNSPVQVGTATTWQSVTAGGYHTLARRTDGTLWVWGLNSTGQLGDGTSGTIRTSPAQLGTATTWQTVVAGGGHTAGELNCRAVWAWGVNTVGQVGDGTLVQRTSPVLVINPVSLLTFSPASAAAGATVAVTGTGLLGLTALSVNGATVPLTDISNITDTGFSFIVPAGATAAGTTTVAAGCGTASSTGFTVPPVLSGLSPWVGVPGTVLTLTGTSLTGATSITFSGSAGTKTVTSGFTVNGAGTSITGIVVPTGAQSGPVTVTTPGGTSVVGTVFFSRAKTLALGDVHTVAVRDDGTLWAWGWNAMGQLGKGTNTISAADYSPVQIGTATNWVSAAAGANHTVAVRADGTLWTWGFNQYGQLGKGYTFGSPNFSPVQIGTATNWVSAAAGANHTVAVRADGTLWAWGNNTDGQLGKGTNTVSAADYSPVQVGTATNWVSASASINHTVAVRTNGTLWTWGYNFFGQLGKGTITSGTTEYSPAQVGSATTWVSVAAGSGHMAAVRADGTLWTWGRNNDGELGKGTNAVNAADYSPVQVGAATTWLSATAGSGHTAGVRTDGTLWTWGANSFGQLGKGTANTGNATNYSPAQAGTATSWTTVAAGGTTTAGEQSCRAVWAWGANGNGQVGDGSTTSRSSPVQVINPVALIGFTPASAGAGATVAVTGTGLGSVSSLSVNGATVPLVGITNNTATGFSFVVPSGATATGTTTVAAGCGAASSTAFTVVPAPTLTGLSPWIGVPGTVLTLTGTNLTGATSITFTGSAGVKTVTTGFTVNGAGTSITGIVVPAGAQSGPVYVTATGGTSGVGTVFFSLAKTLATGGSHTVAVRADGTLWAWGDNAFGQLGKGTSMATAADYSPVQVGTGTNWVSASAGGSHTVAVRADGTLWAWGGNAFGQLGNNSTTSSSTPVQVGMANNWVSATGGGHHTVAVRADGTLWTWGRNAFGQLGKGTNTISAADYSPVQVGTGTNWVSAAAGSGHTAAVRADGTLWAWGYNLYGQLGQGNNTDVVANYSPVQVGTASIWVSAAGGGYHTVAVRTDGTLWAWGGNGAGQLGKGTATTSTSDFSPVQVGTATTWRSIAAGDDHTAAVRADGTFWTWGDNFYGQLGKGNNIGGTTSYSPVQVGTATNWVSAGAGPKYTAGEQSCRAVWAWGHNNNGQVGDGSTTQRTSPVQVINPVTLLAFSPSSAAAGATVAVTGTGLASLTALSVNGATVPLTDISANTDTGFSFVVPAGATVGAGSTTVAAGCGTASSTGFAVAPSLILTTLSATAELPGQAVILSGTGFTAGSTVSFGGVAAGSVTYTSATSLTATVPVGATPGSSAVVVSNGGTSSAGSPAFEVLQVYRSTAASGCLSTASASITGSGGTGVWRYLRLPGAGGAVVAAIEDTRNLGTVTAGFTALGTSTSTAVRVDGRASRAYLDRNFYLTATNPTFPNQTVRVRFFGLSSELARLTAADGNATAANLKASQYSGANENCVLADNDPTGERRLLAAPATVMAGADWFTAQATVADHFSEFYLTGASAPLPVELVAFAAEKQGSAVALAWRTASEKNADRFEVERSRDGRSFERIGTVAAKGSTTSPSDYAFLDSKYPGETNTLYYRLQQVDTDGSASYSPVRAVTVGGKGLLTLYPNPAHGEVRVLGAAAGATLEVYDATGRRISTATAGADGTALLPLPVELAAGMYVVKCDGQVQRLTVE